MSIYPKRASYNCFWFCITYSTSKFWGSETYLYVCSLPPYTTEWITPIYAQLNIATAASGIIGKYIMTVSPTYKPSCYFSPPANFDTYS